MDMEVKTPTLMKETKWHACEGGGELDECGIVHDALLRGVFLQRCRRIRN